jgi:UDPglucose 6-dehydrogenase
LIGSQEPYVIKKLIELHSPLGGERVIIAPESAQMAKYTANAYLAMRITFINQVANLCEKNGAKISEVIAAIGHDKRIGTHYWYPGLGYGGSCFPKDVKELAAYAKKVGEGTGLLVKIDELNEGRISQKMKQYESIVGGFKGKKVAVLGLSFKPNTNDMREAPALKVIPYLEKAGAQVTTYDPQAGGTASSPYEAAANADVIILLTEWLELTHLDLKRLAQAAHKPCTFIDTRNQYTAAQMKAAGLSYIAVGNS